MTIYKWDKINNKASLQTELGSFKTLSRGWLVIVFFFKKKTQLKGWCFDQKKNLKNN